VHIEVDDVGAGGENVIDFLAEAGEVGGQNRRSNGKRLHGAPRGRFTMARIVA
jgi:hypothetical protein